jgi:hypothetical protein
MPKKILPAVWFQNKLNPAPAPTKKPEVLELLESELAQVVGGLLPAGTDSCSGGCPDDCID